MRGSPLCGACSRSPSPSTIVLSPAARRLAFSRRSSPIWSALHRASAAVPLRIEDYALIGDCETAALVGRDGSIDWLCLPRFDSDSCFAALLGDPENGRWLIAPGEAAQASRRYREDTLILETTFKTSEGSVLLVDFM